MAYSDLLSVSGKYKGEGDPVINDEPNCENECHCDDELPCFFTNGTCKDGCATGWRGITCNERDCGVEKGGCQYQCTEDKRDEWCSCDEGFDISPNDWRKCIDIDECAGERGEDYDEDCHICVNTIGSYTCECGDSYELDSATNQTCFDISIKSSPSVAAKKQTPEVTYCNTSGKHPTTLDNSVSDGNPAVAQFEEARLRIDLSKTAKPLPMKPDEKLDFVQVDSFRGKWSFFAFQCPKGNAAVGRFWRLVTKRKIKNVVLLDDASIKVLPAVGGSMFDDIKVFCKKEWQNKGIKKFTVTFSNEQLGERTEYANHQSGISVLTMDNELTNKAIISLRQNLISVGRSPKCAIMCKDGTQFSGFFISVSCTLDMVDEGNKMDSLYGLHKFKTVRPDFAPTE
ncbi:hypothetical protein CAPTEDRAFT_196125, partial [Capitella teleta]